MSSEEQFDLIHLFGREQLNEIQERLSRITRLGFVTADYRGEPQTEYTSFCDFCSHFRNHEVLSKNCVASDAVGSIQAAISQKPLIYMCPCGLMEISIPIVVNGTYLGGFLCGQATCKNPPADMLRMRPALDDELFRETVQKAQSDLGSLPSFDYQHFKDIADLVNMVVTLLCENKIGQIRHERKLHQQLMRSAFMESHIPEIFAVLRGDDYAVVRSAAGAFAAAVFERVPESVEDRFEYLRFFLAAMAQQEAGEHTENAVSLYPLKELYAENEYTCAWWLMQIMDYMYRQHKSAEYPILDPVFQYINQHLTDELTLTILVDACSVSQSYLSRLFRNQFGISVTDYIHMRKLQAAKGAMLFEKKSAADCAYSYGYNEYTYFSKIFKKYVGITISNYRKLWTI